MIDCKHKPIRSQISISKNLYKAVFEDVNIEEPISFVEFRYFEEDDTTELIYLDSQYLISHNIKRNTELTLFNEDGHENIQVMNFFDGIIKMCKECFFEYMIKYKLEICKK